MNHFDYHMNSSFIRHTNSPSQFSSSKKEEHDHYSSPHFDSLEHFSDDSNLFKNETDLKQQSSLLTSNLMRQRTAEMTSLRSQLEEKADQQLELSLQQVRRYHQKVQQFLRIKPSKFSMLLNHTYNREKIWADNFHQKYYELRIDRDQRYLALFHKNIVANRVTSRVQQRQVFDSPQKLVGSRVVFSREQSPQSVNMNPLKERQIRQIKEGQYKELIMRKSDLIDPNSRILSSKYFRNEKYINKLRESWQNTEDNIPEHQRYPNVGPISRSRSSANFNLSSESHSQLRSSQYIYVLMEKSKSSKQIVGKIKDQGQKPYHIPQESQYFPQLKQIVKSTKAIQTVRPRTPIFMRKYPSPQHLSVIGNFGDVAKSDDGRSKSTSRNRLKIFTNQNLQRSRLPEIQHSSRVIEIESKKCVVNRKLQIQRLFHQNQQRQSLQSNQTRKYVNVNNEKKSPFNQRINRHVNFPSESHLVNDQRFIVSQFVDRTHEQPNYESPQYFSKAYVNQNQSPHSGVNPFELYSKSPKKDHSNKQRFSEYSEQKQQRRSMIPQTNISLKQLRFVKSYSKHFGCSDQLWRFRRNCFSENVTLYASNSLLISAIFQRGINGLNLSIMFINQTKGKLHIEVTYKIPRCFDVVRRSSINKKILLESKGDSSNTNLHVFTLTLVDNKFKLLPCLLSLSYRTKEEATFNRQIVLPITLKNFVQTQMCSSNQWQQRYNEYRNHKFQIMKSSTFQLDKNITMGEIHQLLSQFTELEPRQYYSILQLGALCTIKPLKCGYIRHGNKTQHQVIETGMNFLIRVLFRTQKIVIVELMSPQNTENQETLYSFLDQYQNLIVMLLSKLDWQKLA